MSVEDKTTALRPRARLMRHLGQDLIPTDRVAITELVKNSYDADATIVVLRFVRDEHSGTVEAIEFWDDGHGMSEDIVTSVWLEIANPHRSNNPTSESGKRRVLGAKGLGRFAVARLAQTTLLVTRRRDGDETTVLVDWAHFDDDEAYLDEIPVSWDTGPAEYFQPGGLAQDVFTRPIRDLRLSEEQQQHLLDVTGTHGTLLRLESLRANWDADAINELRTALSRLVPPAPAQDLDAKLVPEFAIFIDADDVPGAASGPVAPNAALEHPRYQLTGTVTADGVVSANFSAQGAGGEAEETLTETVTSDVGTAIGAVGPLRFDLRAWDLEGASLKDLLALDVGVTNVTGLRRLIRDNSGIAIYRDGFRVQPYGDPDVDWLNLDLRRVNNPTMRLSNNQVAGFIFIGADDNPQLEDQANRLGLIQNAAYASLREVLSRLINLVEQRRYNLRRPSRAERGPEQNSLFENFNLRPLREVVSARHQDDPALRDALEQTQQQINVGVDGVKDVISSFSVLATLGSLVDVILHEGRTSLTYTAYEIDDLEQEATRSCDDEARNRIARIASALSTQQDAMTSLFDRIEPLSGRRRGRPREVQLHAAIAKGLAVIEREVLEQRAKVTLLGEDQTVRIDEGDIMAMVTNLVRNALYWTTQTQPRDERFIEVTASRLPDRSISIIVEDNGPGVPEENVESIFDPYFSTKTNGTGMGLSIVGVIAGDYYDGSLDLLPAGQLGGARFEVTLRKRVG